MLRFTTFYGTYLIEASSDEGEGSKGSKTAHRGNLNELSFIHASELYYHHLHKGHDEAINTVLEKGHYNPGKIEQDNPLPTAGGVSSVSYEEKHKTAVRSLGTTESQRVLRDSHYAAVAAIDYIHRIYGHVTGPAYWAGGDTSGKTVAKITGGKATQADVVFPVRQSNGENSTVRVPMGGKNSKGDYIGGSLKYSQGGSKKTKLFQPKLDSLVEAIQTHHTANFEERHEGLDKATEKLKTAFSGVHERLKKHDTFLTGVLGEKNKNTGNFTSDQLDKLRYASEALGGDTAKNKKIRDHLGKKMNIPKEDHDYHIKKMSRIYEQQIARPKRDAAKDFNRQLGSALKKSFTKAAAGQNALVRSLTNIKHRKDNSNTLLFKTERGKGNNEPVVKVANHPNVLESLQKRGERMRPKSVSENGLYNAHVSENGNVSVHHTLDGGEKLFGFSIDTSKSTPSVIIQAGSGIDRHDKQIKLRGGN